MTRVIVLVVLVIVLRLARVVRVMPQRSEVVLLLLRCGTLRRRI